MVLLTKCIYLSSEIKMDASLIRFVSLLSSDQLVSRTQVALGTELLSKLFDQRTTLCP
jgi:hypothetical protein